MAKRLFAATLFAILFASHANAWDMGAYVENAHAGEGIKDTAFVWKDEQAQPEAAEDSSMALTQEKKEKYKEIETKQKANDRRGFYFSAGLSIGYTSLNNSEVDRKKRKTSQKFSGLSFPFIETRFGHNIANIVSVYGALGIGIGYGSFYGYSTDVNEGKINAVSMRGLVGLGAEFYPIPDKESALYGLYVGLCVGAAAERAQAYVNEENTVGYTYYMNEPELDIFDNTFVRVEAGYDFWYGERWRIGTALNYSFGKYDSDDSDELVTTSHNIGLTIKIAR